MSEVSVLLLHRTNPVLPDVLSVSTQGEEEEAGSQRTRVGTSRGGEVSSTGIHVWGKCEGYRSY